MLEIRERPLRLGPLALRGRGVMLTAREGGRSVLRLNTGSLGGAAGFFGDFAGENRPEAAALLLARAANLQREWGSATLEGPNPPGILSLGEGLLVAGFSEPASRFLHANPPYLEGLLIASGFAVAQEYRTYRFRAEDVDWARYGRLEEWARRRFQATVHPLDPGRRADCDAVWRVLEGAYPFEAVARALEALRRRIDKRYFLLVRLGGEPAGFFLACPDKGKSLFLYTLHVRARFRHTPASGLLFAAMLREARKGGFARAETGPVAADNPASIAGVLRAGGEPARVYRRYRLNLQ